MRFEFSKDVKYGDLTPWTSYIQIDPSHEYRGGASLYGGSGIVIGDGERETSDRINIPAEAMRPIASFLLQLADAHEHLLPVKTDKQKFVETGQLLKTALDAMRTACDASDPKDGILFLLDEWVGLVDGWIGDTDNNYSLGGHWQDACRDLETL